VRVRCGLRRGEGVCGGARECGGASGVGPGRVRWCAHRRGDACGSHPRRARQQPREVCAQAWVRMGYARGCQPRASPLLGGASLPTPSLLPPSPFPASPHARARARATCAYACRSGGSGRGPAGGPGLPRPARGGGGGCGSGGGRDCAGTARAGVQVPCFARAASAFYVRAAVGGTCGWLPYPLVS
jgi:hypothetical protein